MRGTIVGEATRIVVAVWVCANELAWTLLYVLSEVQKLSWVDLISSRILEIFIRYLSIFIAIEPVKELFKLLIRQV